MIQLWSFCFVFVDVTGGIFFFLWPWYYYAEPLNSWVAWKFIFPQKNHLACLLMAESTIGTFTKEEAYFTSSNHVFHSTWNSRQKTKGLFKKQFQANYDLKWALKELWWKATILFLRVFLLPFLPLLLFGWFLCCCLVVFFVVLFKENTRLKPVIIQEETILIQFRVFQPFLFSDLSAPERTLAVTSVRWCVPYLKFAPFQLLSDFHGSEVFIFFLKVLYLK